LVSDEQIFEKNKAQYFKFIGKKRREGKWRTGLYNGVVTLMRGNERIIYSEKKILLD